jgi:mannose-1-phosphate guanylyltransferase/mannose-1-phosphate guanylyltransferase/mannose-6-phosphate isomerase
MSAIVPVILSGGNGTRLWPRSRPEQPKPFLPLIGEETLFQQALSRCAGAQFAAPVVVTGASHVPHVEAQGTGVADLSVIVEPEGKNTAAAVALAALRLPADAVMLVLPSDHHIAGRAAFVDAACEAAKLAGEGWLVALGIAPERPETGYGYLRRGEPLGGTGYRVAQFVEKPDAATAVRFLADGGYSWNGGIFALRAGTYLEELETHRPALAQAVREAVAGGHEDGARFRPDAVAFARIEAESIDYAVMENTARAAMVPVAMGWSDIGDWRALHAAHAPDANGNIADGPAELTDCRNVMVVSDGPRVSVIGLTDVVVVIDGDDVLVTTHAGAQKVGKLTGARGG